MEIELMKIITFNEYEIFSKEKKDQISFGRVNVNHIIKNYNFNLSDFEPFATRKSIQSIKFLLGYF